MPRHLDRAKIIKNDEFPTPRSEVEWIFDNYQDRWTGKRIVCPFDSAESEFVKVATERGFEVLYSRGDYKSILPLIDARNDVIVSNPPFSIKGEIKKDLDELKVDWYMILPKLVLTTLSYWRVNVDGRHPISLRGWPECYLMSNKELHTASQTWSGHDAYRITDEGWKEYPHSKDVPPDADMVLVNVHYLVKPTAPYILCNMVPSSIDGHTLFKRFLIIRPRSKSFTK